LTKEEIDKMVREAEEHAAEDRKQKELIEARNQADSVIYSVEKTLREYGEKISFEERAEIGKKLEALKQKKEGNDISAIKQAIDDLQQSVYKLSEAVYREAASRAQQQTGPTGGQKPEEGSQPGGTDYRVVDEEGNK